MAESAGNTTSRLQATLVGKVDKLRDAQRTGLLDPAWGPVDILALINQIAMTRSARNRRRCRRPGRGSLHHRPPRRTDDRRRAHVPSPGLRPTPKALGLTHTSGRVRRR
ncbi:MULTISPECIES: hypothetical protein [Streptomyces]|uniref:hypothetical protein n=1 Tax=Streptomyces TaxID=1883 RepID=UPI0029B3F258|nr:hypothetical protein [Streptomyces sp. NE06-03C]MDX2918346.1 hypothetical protein [Streptomyces sp. NE06-03C]